MSRPKPRIIKVNGLWIAVHPGPGIYHLPALMTLAVQFCTHLNMGEK